MQPHRRRLLHLAVAALALTVSTAMTGEVAAQEVKVGIVLSYTGVLAEDSEQIDRGIASYLNLNADAVKPYTIKLIKRDSKAPNGAEAKVAVQELLTQNKVDALAGWLNSPDAIASAPVVNADKKLAVIMNAGTAFITNLSPDFVRTSFSMWHAKLRDGHRRRQNAARKNGGRCLFRFPARQGQPGRLQEQLRG
jgi:branched-chain amino acid transport system substrate-binding protein